MRLVPNRNFLLGSIRRAKLQAKHIKLQFELFLLFKFWLKKLASFKFLTVSYLIRKETVKTAAKYHFQFQRNWKIQVNWILLFLFFGFVCFFFVFATVVEHTLGPIQ